jgi:hypothetical protein
MAKKQLDNLAEELSVLETTLQPVPMPVPMELDTPQPASAPDAANIAPPPGNSSFVVSADELEAVLANARKAEEREQALMRKSQEMEQYRYRVGREVEGREHDTRTTSMRKFWMNAWKGHLYIDPDVVPEGEVWLWAAASVKNEPDMQNIQQLYRKGWRPVRPEECPDLTISEDFASHFGVTDKNFIRIGGSILMKRSKAINDEENAVLTEKIRKVDASIAHTTKRMGYDAGITFNQVGTRSEKTTKWNMSI